MFHVRGVCSLAGLQVAARAGDVAAVSDAPYTLNACILTFLEYAKRGYSSFLLLCQHQNVHVYEGVAMRRDHMRVAPPGSMSR